MKGRELMTTTTRPTIRGRAAAERLLQAIDDAALSVADAAVTAGLPVDQIEGLLHQHPDRLGAETAAQLADALGVTLPPTRGRAHPSWCRGNDHPHECQPFDAGGADEFHVHRATLFGTSMQDESGSVSVELIESATGKFTPYARVIAFADADTGMTPARARVFAQAIAEAAAIAEVARP